MKAGFRVDINGDGKPDANVNSGFGGLDSFVQNTLNNLDSSVLVLDDLERCEIPIPELLGVINGFIEHGDMRVILIANSKKLEDTKFAEFREKIIGHSFMLENDPEDALDAFINEIGDTSGSMAKKRDIVRDQNAKSGFKYLHAVCKYIPSLGNSDDHLRENDPEDARNAIGDTSGIIAKNQDVILDLHAKSEHKNLRALRQYIHFLGNLLSNLDDAFCENEVVIDRLITQAFIFFIEFKLHLQDDNNPLGPTNLLMDEDFLTAGERYVSASKLFEENEKTPKGKVFEKYDMLGGIHTIITVTQWVSILETGVVDRERFNREVGESTEVVGNSKWPSWKKLWYFFEWDFSDGDEGVFYGHIEDVENKLKDGGYDHPLEFLHVVGIKLHFCWYKITFFENWPKQRLT